MVRVWFNHWFSTVYGLIELIKQDKNELKKMKAALGDIDKSEDPTAGAGMSMDDVVNKLMQQNNIKPNFTEQEKNTSSPDIKRPEAPKQQMQSDNRSINQQKPQG